MRLMTTREALAEIRSLATGDTSIQLYPAGTTKADRIAFLCDMIAETLPEDPDFEAMAKAGILV